VIVAAGLHAAIRETYFRVGHMGWVATQPALLAQAARAIGEGLGDCGARVDPAAAERAVTEALGASSGC
jgi:aspartate aminotransferase-like enzyme